jgi:hypothetical protein
MEEVRDWIKAREESLKNGAKAVVLKVNKDTLKQIGKDLDIKDGDKKNLVLAIIDKDSKDITESLLVKYETLDKKLEDALAKGNGVLVVEG